MRQTCKRCHRPVAEVGRVKLDTPDHVGRRYRCPECVTEATTVEIPARLFNRYHLAYKTLSARWATLDSDVEEVG